jgi:hypothetical protein
MSQRERVYTMLKQAGERGVTTADFLQAYTPRFSARIKELRDAGHVIETERISSSSSRYKLLPANQVCPVAGARGGSEVLGGPETGSRGSRRGVGIVPYTEPTQRAAAISGKRADTLGGDGSPAVTALPTLFELPRSGSAGHYGEAA